MNKKDDDRNGIEDAKNNEGNDDDMDDDSDGDKCDLDARIRKREHASSWRMMSTLLRCFRSLVGGS